MQTPRASLGLVMLCGQQLCCSLEDGGTAHDNKIILEFVSCFLKRGALSLTVAGH